LNVKYIGVDIAGLVQTVQNNPTLYGFTSATVFPGVEGTTTGSACVTPTGSTGQSGWGQWCANTTQSSTIHAYLRSADAELTSFYADDQHFSFAGHKIVADLEIGLIDASVTPTPAALPLFATGLGVIGLLARRRKRMAYARFLTVAALCGVLMPINATPRRARPA
jgi:hypothetical protein